MTEAELISEIEMQPEEIEEITDGYEQSIDEIARAAGETATPLVLMTVAANWEWRGREDLPADWLDELVPPDGTSEPARYRRAVDLLAEKIASSPPGERSEWQFKRAAAAEALGDYATARREYRAAMNSDPHLRRALDSMADRVRGVAERREVALVDVIEHLSRHAEHGIVGFDEFYDYVHFTPRGALLVAAAAFEELVAAGIVPEPDDFDLDAFVRDRLAYLAELRVDPLEVREWLGFGFDPAGIHDRDLWKYDRFVNALDERIEARPDDVRARVYRGNAAAFRIDGAAQAARDYRAALEIADDPAIRANLDRLLAGRRP
jgi:tetratricopeptide (TPR) repeat protein